MKPANICVKQYYVTMRTDGGRTALLAGPFLEHKDALAAVENVREMACKIDPFFHFNWFGTSALWLPIGSKFPNGKLTT